MKNRRWIKFDELREPGMRRALEAMMLVDAERKDAVDEIDVPAGVLIEGRVPDGCGSTA